MEVCDLYGLSIALIGPDEVADEPWARVPEHIDVVRMPEPPASCWAALAAKGFIRKPTTVTWAAELTANEGEFFARLERRARQGIRRARSRAEAAGLRQVTEDPVSVATLDAFLKLYEQRVGDMRFGVPFALRYRDVILHGPDKFFGVFAFEEDELVGGTLVLERPADDTAVLRFSAVSAEWRKVSLARSLYPAAMEIARTKGYTRATLGNEPNLLGHLTQPGLLVFKADLGFRAVPSQDFADPQGTDEADLVVSLTALNDPTLILGYADQADPAERRLAGHLICEAKVDPGVYATFLTAMYQHRPG
jgi:GNAT superfamily N-acetyltransferase